MEEHRSTLFNCWVLCILIILVVASVVFQYDPIEEVMKNKFGLNARYISTHLLSGTLIVYIILLLHRRG